MREKYKRRIRKFAEQTLEDKLKQEIGHYFNDVLFEIQDTIKNEVTNFPLPDEESLNPRDRYGPQLQRIGREIADKLLDKITKQISPFVEKDVKRRRKELTEDLSLAAKSEDAITKLKNKIENGFVGKSRQYWRGADVIITPTRVPEENLAWTHTDDIQVVTETEELACSISWLFMQVRDIMSPFIDFENKYEFYGVLAETANRIIASGREYNEKDVLIAILSEVERFRTEWAPGLNDYFDEEKTLLDEAEIWISKNRHNDKA